jgi:hypothetical protein
MDALLSARRDLAAARRFFTRALRAGPVPIATEAMGTHRLASPSATTPCAGRILLERCSSPGLDPCFLESYIKTNFKQCKNCGAGRPSEEARRALSARRKKSRSG